MDRRGFLGSILALSASPAIVRADSLMRIVPRTLILYGDGVHDDTEALQAVFARRRVILPAGVTAQMGLDGLYHINLGFRKYSASRLSLWAANTYCENAHFVAANNVPHN